MPLAALLLAAAAPVLGCDDRITGAFTEYPDGRRVEDRFEIDRRRDVTAGPLAYRGLRSITRAEWDSYVARDQWLKSPPVLRPGRTVTVEVPRSQRAWMKIVHGGSRLTLRSCTRGGSGSSGNTAWSGGFEIDYANAPQQGRCARLIIRVRGRAEPIRRRLVPKAGSC